MKRYLRHWERFAQRDPYFAVLTDARFRAQLMAERSLEEFFASGTAYVEFLLRIIRERLDASMRIRSALDFGCGVGRLTVPLARVCEVVTAVDASPQMLAETETNCRRFDISNVQCRRLEEFVNDSMTFDLVNAYIVFQHIPVSEGERLYRVLMERVHQGGIAALHFVYKRRGSRWRQIFGRARAAIPGVHLLVNLLQRRSPSEPHMQMNAYPIDRVLDALQLRGFGRLFSCFTDHGGYRGVLIVAQRAELKVP